MEKALLTIYKEPGKGPTAKVIIQLQPGETLAEAVERTRREFRRVTIGMLDGWTAGVLARHVTELQERAEADETKLAEVAEFTAPGTMGGGKRCD